MITEEEKNQLKAVLPPEYAKEISKRLNESGFSPRRARMYNPKIVRSVFNGEQSDINVELNLFRFHDELLEKKRERKERSRKLLNSESKPENQ